MTAPDPVAKAPSFELEPQGTLLIWLLSVRSSYSENVEVDAAEKPADTLQWWIGTTTSWRIRTYAIDHDIHAHALSSAGPEIEALAVSNTEKTYGDVIAAHHRVEIDDATEPEAAVRRALEPSGLAVRIEARGPFAFWPPDTQEPYRTKSTPR